MTPTIGTSNFDYIIGSNEPDTITLLQGNDIGFGLAENDEINGNEGKDKLFGNNGNDTIFGNQDDDVICGGKGTDLIRGDEGNDVLYGDKGSDTLEGGLGDDIFTLARGSGGTTIATADYFKDFGNGNDQIRLIDGLTLADLNIVSNDNNTVIQDKITGEYLAVLPGVVNLTPDKFTTFNAGKIILDWNKTLLDAIKVEKTAPPIASRQMAIVHTAIYDAVNSINPQHQPYLTQLPVPPTTSKEAAIAAAAHRTLVNLFPKQSAKFDQDFQMSLANIPDSQAKSDGIALGETVADRILAARANDGANTTVTYTPENQPGKWIPTPPGFTAAVLPHWGNVQPFGITSGSQFRPVAPPALDTPEYAVEVNQVKEIGKIDSSIRTADQTEIAEFWSNGPGTFTPPGHWNQIAQDISSLSLNSLEEKARLFALLNIALADAGIASWDGKYAYNYWRPVTAIQKADQDNNPATTADPNWQPLLTTPAFPEYISGHSTFSGAADPVMSSIFGNDFGFADRGDSSVNTFRKYNNFAQAADESGVSRIYGGIHFESANANGLATGRNIGNYVMQNLLT